MDAGLAVASARAGQEATGATLNTARSRNDDVTSVLPSALSSATASDNTIKMESAAQEHLGRILLANMDFGEIQRGKDLVAWIMSATEADISSLLTSLDRWGTALSVGITDLWETTDSQGMDKGWVSTVETLVLPVARPIIRAALNTKTGAIVAEDLQKRGIINLKKV